jgi:MFS family permease
MLTRLLLLVAVICVGYKYATGRWPWVRKLSARQQAVFRARRLLGVEERAGREDIIAAHRKLIALVHPDRGGSADAVHEANAARDLLLARIGVGVGEAGGTPACNSIIADYFPADRRSMAMTIFALGAPIGAWLGSDLAGYISNLHGWRAAFLVLGVPGIILAVIIMVTIKEPTRGRLDAVVEEKAPSVMETMRFLWSQKAAVHAMMGAGLSAFWGWGLMWFTPLFLQRTYGMDEGAAGGLLGEIYLVGGIGASLVTAYVVARPSFTDPRKISNLLAVVTAVATIPSFLAYWTYDLGVAKLMWWIFIPAIYFYIGPAMALCQNLAAPKMRAMSIAISLIIANLLNLIVAPAIVGGLSDYFAGSQPAGAESLRLAQLVLAPSGLWAAWHYWRASKYIIEDQKRAVGYV